MKNPEQETLSLLHSLSSLLLIDIFIYVIPILWYNETRFKSTALLCADVSRKLWFCISESMSFLLYNYTLISCNVVTIICNSTMLVIERHLEFFIWISSIVVQRYQQESINGSIDDNLGTNIYPRTHVLPNFNSPVLNRRVVPPGLIRKHVHEYI